MNNNGTISREEMLAGLKRLHLPITDKQFGKVIRRADADGGGSIDLNEFKAAFESGGRAEYVLCHVYMNASCHKYAHVMSHTWITYMRRWRISRERAWSGFWTSVKWLLSRRAALSVSCHTCMNALWHTRAGVRSRTWMRHITYMSSLYHTNGWVWFTCVTWRLHMCVRTYSHVSHEAFMCVCDLTHPRVWLSRADAMSRTHRVAHHTCIRRVTCMNASCQSHTWRRHVTRVNASCHAHECVTTHTWMSLSHTHTHTSFHTYKWRAFSTLSQYTCMVTNDRMMPLSLSWPMTQWRYLRQMTRHSQLYHGRYTLQGGVEAEDALSL